MTRLIVTLALLTAPTACTAERSLSPEPSVPVLASSLTRAAPQVPLLFVVDGVLYQRDQLPLLTEDRIFAVRVIKGHAALDGYGPDGAYGVVVITTRQAVTPQA
jgi:hypothetical protein